MFPSIRTGVVAVTLVSSIGLAGCAAIRVNSYSETGTTMPYRTYAWAPTEAVATGDPRLDNNTFFADRVRDSVDRELAARGFEKTGSGSPDALLHFHASITQEISLSGTTDRFNNCQNCGGSVYDAGTLVIDLVDSKTSRLVWRGWAEGVDPVIDNQDWMEETIDNVVAKIMKKLPPHS